MLRRNHATYIINVFFVWIFSY